MIRRILHPSDFSSASRAAFAKAVALAKQNRAQLIVAHVLTPMLAVGDGAISADTYAELEAAGRRYGTRQLDALTRRAKKAGVRARGLLLDGTAAEQIVRAARRQRADLIVIGTHGRTGFARFFLGSVASRVMSHAACPVMTVRGR
jgi:nucleotide-binding universal stress UspA family protein